MKRANIVITDEFMLIKKKDFDEIISPTLEPRHFAGRPVDYHEEPKQIFLSSARTKSNWGWKQTVTTVTNHYKGGKIKYGFYIGDIFTAVANGIQTKNQYIQRKRDTDDMSFMQEYLNIFLGNSEDSIFKYEDFEQNQTIEEAFYPRDYQDLIDGKEQTYKFKDNRIYYLTSDIAVATGDDNDNTVFILGYVDLDTGRKGYDYVATLSGTNSIEQVIMIKRLFYEYHCSYFVQDSKGIGNVLYDLLTVPTYDKLYDTTYPAWTANTIPELQISSDTVINDKVIRTMSNDAVSVIIPFAGTAELNSNGHLALRKALKDKQIDLLMDDYEKKGELEDKNPRYILKDSEEKTKILLPFVQTRFLINEAVALEVKFTETGNIKLQEAKRTATKDRYMTLMMANMFGDKLLNYYSNSEGIDDADLDDLILVY